MKVQIKVKMKGDPWVVVLHEVQGVQGSRSSSASTPRPMPRFWEMHVDEVKAQAAAHGLEFVNVRKAELVAQLVEANRQLYHF